jgi:hypothetical protein
MDDSDEEFQSINDVALLEDLDSQLKQAGCPCDENLFVPLFLGLDKKPAVKRLKIWRLKKSCSKN